MKKTAIFLMIVTAMLIWAPVFAKHSDDFILGTYSYISNSGKPWEREAMYHKMRELGYNSNIAETHVDNADFDTLMQEMDAWGLDVWISDKTWDSATRNASYALSTANHIRFEAEYAGESELNPGDGWDSGFWYASRSDKNMARVGRPKRLLEASNGWVWQANKGRDSQGWIFTDLRYRWPNQGGAYVRLGKEFLIHDSQNPDGQLYIKFRLRILDTQKNLSADAPLLNFSLCGYEYSANGHSSQVRVLTHLFQGRRQTVTYFNLNDHLLSKSGDFIELELQVPYAALLEANLLKTGVSNDPKGMARLVNLNPRIWWYGNCDVEVDWVSVEDQIHHDLRPETASGLSAALGKRMNELQKRAPGNLSGFYLMDEPRAGQFAGRNLVQQEAKKQGIPVIAAVYDYLYQQYPINEKSGVYYDNVEAFYKNAEPEIITPNIYPLSPNLKWSPRDGNPGPFIQNLLDEKLISIYRKSMEYRDGAQGRGFIPIVQVLGSWTQNAEGNQWQSWIQPPTATQKVLLYLPLCFAPDGIFHYRLREFQNEQGIGNRAATFSQVGAKSYPDPVEDPISWPAVFESNPRVLEYGKALKNLSWLGTEVIGTAKSQGKKWHKQSLTKSAQVQKRGNGDYEGYVQCAWYQDGDGTPWFMMVNRRANYFKPLVANEPRFVPPSDFELCFPEAEPQILVINFDKKKLANWGKNPALYDIYEQTLYPIQNNQVQILLPAGEGRLLKLVAHKDLGL
ncbi:MAG: hypothetical protein WCY21_03425 [Candidatus Cloacimonadaceae bacterium]|jgi:hypothetical protein|nr:hypothetical protein [Candidatus Cloacimonadota bacterium]MDX9949398.1 hypothetical protein [Candidatus Syntrophosphaera sp.]